MEDPVRFVNGTKGHDLIFCFMNYWICLSSSFMLIGYNSKLWQRWSRELWLQSCMDCLPWVWFPHCRWAVSSEWSTFGTGTSWEPSWSPAQFHHRKFLWRWICRKCCVAGDHSCRTLSNIHCQVSYIYICVNVYFNES